MSRQYSNASHAEASAATCSGAVIFGRVTTKFGGSVPPLFSSSVVRNRSKVRKLRRFNSSLSGLIRMPIDGGRVPSCMPAATSAAARRACSSSS